MKNLMTALLLLAALRWGAGAAQAEPLSAGSPSPPPTGHSDAELARTVAEHYGFAQWGEVAALTFTFNVKTPEREVARAWSWAVAEHAVTQRGLKPGEEDVIVDLNQDPAGWTKDQRRVHQQFINDSYWLLFPFQLVWSDPTVTDAGATPLPAGTGSGRARKVVAQWPAEGGYTPGDAYDLFLDDAGTIRAWTFRRDGGEAGRSMTFEGYEQVGPLLLSLDHRGADDFRLFFTDVELTLRTGERASASGSR